MEYGFLSQTPLFRGLTKDEVQEVLGCVAAGLRQYEKGNVILHMGESTEAMGLLLSGSAIVESGDLWGNNSVLGHIEAGEIFAETYACLPGEALLVNVVAREPCRVLFLSMPKLLSPCARACGKHNRLIQNLVILFAQKNLGLSRRILHTSAKSIRGRLLSYLSEQAKRNGGYSFAIPFNRQQLADYLGVDRSALSGELSKMRKEGLLDYQKNAFILKKTEEM